jgi:predicted kinase
VRRAAGVVGSGHSVILDATFSERRWRDAVARLAGEAGAGFAFVETRCADTQILRKRLGERRHAASISDATDEQLAGSERRFEPLAAGEPGPRLTIDTGSAPAGAVDEALRGLQRIGIVTARDRCAS